VDVNERFGGKGGETDEAHSHSDRLLTLESQKDQSRRVPLQSGNQTRPHIGIEWFGTAIASIE
jgi:hypothetical protein